MYTADPQGVYRADNHGWFIATSDGKVLQAGPSKQMNWITTTGSGTITPAGNRGNSADAMNGNAVTTTSTRSSPWAVPRPTRAPTPPHQRVPDTSTSQAAPPR